MFYLFSFDKACNNWYIFSDDHHNEQQMLVTEAAVTNMEKNTLITSTAYERENTDLHFYFLKK